MSTAIPFDTLAFVKELETAGIPPAHAEAQAKALATVMRQVYARVDELAAKRDKQTEERFGTLKDQNEHQVKSRLDGLSTKQELAIVEANLKREIEAVKKEIEASKSETIKWTAGMFTAQTALIIGALFTWMKMNQPPPVLTPAQHAPAAQETRLPASPAAPVVVSPPSR